MAHTCRRRLSLSLSLFLTRHCGPARSRGQFHVDRRRSKPGISSCTTRCMTLGHGDRPSPIAMRGPRRQRHRHTDPFAKDICVQGPSATCARLAMNLTTWQLMRLRATRGHISRKRGRSKPASPKRNGNIPWLSMAISPNGEARGEDTLPTPGTSARRKETRCATTTQRSIGARGNASECWSVAAASACNGASSAACMCLWVHRLHCMNVPAGHRTTRRCVGRCTCPVQLHVQTNK